MIQLRDRRVEREEVQLGKDDVYYLGPNLHLKHCKVTLRTNARALIIVKTTFEDCEIVARQKLSNFPWYYARLQRCRFAGKFSGCDFGHWPEDDPAAGGIEHCDFLEASLDGCRFLDCDVTTLRLPAWPCFTILDPVGNLPRLSARPWPGRADVIVQYLAICPPQTSAVTYLATEADKQFGASEAELRAFLEQFDDIIL